MQQNDARKKKRRLSRKITEDGTQQTVTNSVNLSGLTKLPAHPRNIRNILIDRSGTVGPTWSKAEINEEMCATKSLMTVLLHHL